jgi:threonine synthase
VNTSRIETTDVICSNCRQPYPSHGTPYRCPHCSGFFDFPVLPGFDLRKIDPAQPGIWRYRHTFGLSAGAPLVTIGEGNTPLVWLNAFGRKIAFKLEYLNPTGSFKDRGSAILVSFLRSRGIREAVEDSSGNAGASYAAYAAAAGIKARVYVPDYASGPKRAQIEAYGAEVIRILGTRLKTTEIALKAVEKGAIYASHAYMPYGLAGYATLAYEFFEQLGDTPGTVVMPAGQGGLLLGVGRGFENLRRAGLIERLPEALGWVAEGETLAEGVRVRQPLRGDRVLQIVRDSGGQMLAVDEPAILPGQAALAQLGQYVEPTSAIVWNALEQLGDQLVDPVVVILTGSGLKSP